MVDTKIDAVKREECFNRHLKAWAPGTVKTISKEKILVEFEDGKST